MTLETYSRKDCELNFIVTTSYLHQSDDSDLPVDDQVPFAELADSRSAHG